jgi:hypothetical protein
MKNNKQELTCETWSAIECKILFHLDIYVDVHPVLFDFINASATTSRGHQLPQVMIFFTGPSCSK